MKPDIFMKRGRDMVKKEELPACLVATIRSTVSEKMLEELSALADAIAASLA